MAINNFSKLILLLSVPFIYLACTNTPPEDKIKAAITETLKKKVPIAWSGSLMGGKNAKIELIEIIVIGKQNERGKYWPVKARVKGSCEADLLVRREFKKFDQVGEFRLYKDDYGEWKASMLGL